MTSSRFVAVAALTFAALVQLAPAPAAQRAPNQPMGDGPWVMKTLAYEIRIVKLASVVKPFGMAFPSANEILVTERSGQLRIVRNGVLDPQPITGGPTVFRGAIDGLLDIALHPRFAENHLVYFNYSKADENGAVAIAVFRARLEGMALREGRDIFVANTATPKSQQIGATGRIAFGRDGMLYMSVGSPYDDRIQAQNPNSHRGKILRLRDDGTAPPDNPFVGKTAMGYRYQPEIFAMGIRNPVGLALNPATGDMWENENGPQGGDEINIILPGRNYGWPLVSMGREYDGTPYPPSMDGMEPPLQIWVPSIAPSGMAFYTGDLFPLWKRNVFVGGLAGKRLERLAFNDKWEPIRPLESLLLPLGQRIRDVRQGPDGRLYVLTDENDGALLAIEPVPESASSGTVRR